MQEEAKTQSKSGKGTALYARVAVLIVIFAAILTYFRHSLRLPFVPPDPTELAESSFRQGIAQESGGQIELVSFRKTDGLASEASGVKCYSLQFDGEIAFARSGYWTSRDLSYLGKLSFEFSTAPSDQGWANGQVSVSANQRVRITGVISGQRTERGWQFTLTSCQMAPN